MFFIKKVAILVFFALISFSGTTQTIQIDYQFKVDDDQNPERNLVSKYSLYDNLNNTLYIRRAVNYHVDSTSVSSTKQEGYSLKQLSDEHIVYESDNKASIFVDKKEGVLLSQNQIAFRPFIVRETLPLIDWVLTEQDTTFLNMNCKIAKADFRGRSWIVFFTDSLVFNTAPWKFHGLPGSVLYATTTDHVFTIEALNIYQSTNTTLLQNPFENQETYTWEEYVKKYKEFNRKYVKKMNSLSKDEFTFTVKSLWGLEDLGFTKTE